MEASKPTTDLETISTELLIAAILTLILVSAYFSGSETALMSINRYRLQHLQQKKYRAALKVGKLLQRPDRLLGVILIGNNLVNILAASLGTIIGLRLLGDWGALAATVVLTVLFLIFAEVTPKTVAACFPERLAFASVHILDPLLKIFYPLVVVVNAISNRLAGMFGAQPQTKNLTETLSNEELRTLVLKGAAIAGKGEDMMLGVLDLDKVTVDDIMVPKSEVTVIDIEQDMATIVRQICNSQYTRLPIIKGDLGNVLGILHLRKVGHFLLKPESEQTNAELILNSQEACFIPAGTPLSTQLINFQKGRDRIGLIVDEYGDIEGMVTLSDILEEVVGEFTTDVNDNLSEIQQQSDGAYLIEGTSHLRYINRTLGWELPLDGPKTLSGLIIEYLETIPEGNVCVAQNGYRLETVRISNNMVRMAKVSRISSAEPT